MFTWHWASGGWLCLHMIIRTLPKSEFKFLMCRQCQYWWTYGGFRGSSPNSTASLQWRHNDQDSVSNDQPHGCLLNRLFRRRSKKTPKLRVTGLCVVNSPVTGESPHKWPVTRKIFPFDDVTMITRCVTQLNPSRHSYTQITFLYGPRDNPVFKYY